MDCRIGIGTPVSTILYESERLCMSRRKTIEEFKREMYEINKNIEVIGEYRDRNTPIKCHCLICGHGSNGEWSNRPSNLLTKRQGCPKCRDNIFRNKYAKSHDSFMEEMSVKNPTVEVLEEYYNNRTHLLCRCKLCKNEWRAKPKHLLGKCTSCPRCVTNHKREKETMEILGKYYTDLQTEHKFEDLRGVNGGFLRYDAKLDMGGHIYLIEIQGEQHERPIKHMGGEKEFEIRKEHDRRKKEYAEVNGYTLIEVWYYENILDKLRSYGLCKEVISQP